MKLDLFYDTVGWAYFNRCKALCKYAPKHYDLRFDLGNKDSKKRQHKADLALQLCYSHVSALRKSYKKCNPIIVAGLNVGFTEANALWFVRVLKEADHVILNNRDLFEKLGCPSKNVTQISNGIDLDFWKITSTIVRQKPKVLFVGSLFHRKTKGYDKILQPLAAKLWKDGIECDFRLVDSHGGPSQKSPEQLLEWYNTGTVYVVASASEGTPNPALEAAACGCTIVSTRVGNMPELIKDGVSGYFAERDVDDFYEKVTLAVRDYPKNSVALQESLPEWSWEHRAKQYFTLFERLKKCLKT